MDVEIVRGRAAREGEEGLGPQQALGARRDEGHDLMAAANEQPNELARLVGGDATGHTHEHAGHAGIVPLLRVLVLELALGDFLEGHGEVVLGAGLDERRRCLLEADPLTQLVVVVVDLARPFGRDDHKRVARVDVVQELIDAWMDHGRLMVPAVCNSFSTIAWSSSAARSTLSFTIT